MGDSWSYDSDLKIDYTQLTVILLAELLYAQLESTNNTTQLRYIIILLAQL